MLCRFLFDSCGWCRRIGGAPLEVPIACRSLFAAAMAGPRVGSDRGSSRNIFPASSTPVMAPSPDVLGFLFLFCMVYRCCILVQAFSSCSLLCYVLLMQIPLELLHPVLLSFPVRSVNISFHVNNDQVLFLPTLSAFCCALQVLY
jgi:hypothetical protein